MPGPERIGRYRVSTLLGSGGFASVWLGSDERLGEPVAIKVLAENWANVRDVHDRFLQEARLLRQADSDRVVRMYDLGELPDGRPYFVMSHADRGTVAERLSTPAAPVPDALHLAVETARAVAVLHRLGVVHRDIKPSNILLQSTPGGGERVLIGDLGVAKHVAHASGFTVAAGTPGYMSPEQSRGDADIDVRADVYGLGALTYHLLTGTKYDSGGLRGAELPKKLKQVLARALAEDRDRRWPDAGALADALAEHLPAGAPVDANSLPPTRTATAIAAPARPVRRTRVLVIAVACLLAAGAVAATLSLTGDGDDPATPAGESSPEPPPRASPGPLELTFTVKPWSGYQIEESGVDGDTQWAGLRPEQGDAAATVTVYAPGEFDVAQAKDGEAIDVAGRRGFYDKALPDPGTRTRKPAAVVRYAADAWYVVQSDLPATRAREPVSRIAAAVSFANRRQLRFPVRFGHLPDTLHACGGRDGLDPGRRGPWAAWIDLCDDRPGSGIDASTAAIRLMMNAVDESHPPPKHPQRDVDGRPMRLTARGASVDCGEFVLFVWVARSHVSRYSQSDVVDIVEALTVRAYAKKSSWYPGNLAVPNG